MTPALLVMVALAGALGAAARYAIDYAIMNRMRSKFPWGTVVVNVTGSLGLGILAGLTLRLHIPVEVLLVLGGGFLGAYTTFSTWMYETLRLAETGAWRIAIGNIIVSLAAGLGAAGIGAGLGVMMGAVIG